LELRKITMLLATGGLIAAVLISIEINGYAQVPPMQSHFAQKQASRNNDSTTPFSLPSIRLDNPSNITTGKNGPVAIAGPDQIVKEGTTVILNGSGSRDSNGVILSYSWRQIPTNNFITLSGASTPVWSFTAPTVSADTTLKFQLTVTDSSGLNDNSTVNVLVKNIPAQTPSAASPPTGNAVTSNNPPIAGIVPQQTPSAASPPTGNAVTSNNPPIAGIVPQQTPSAAQTSSAASPPTGNAVTSNITEHSNIAANGILTANTGSDRTVQEGTLVILDGNNSTGFITSYSWKQIGGKSVKLTNPDTARSAFIAPDVKRDSILKFRLSVDDDKEKKATSTVNILVVDNNNKIIK
jgi:hypothetical protein